jgi:hypothetical protein
MTREKKTQRLARLSSVFGCCQSETTSRTCDVGQTLINAQYETHITGQKQVRHETQHTAFKGFLVQDLDWHFGRHYDRSR